MIIVKMYAIFQFKKMNCHYSVRLTLCFGLRAKCQALLFYLGFGDHELEENSRIADRERHDSDAAHTIHHQYLSTKLEGVENLHSI